jgi:MoxR-like ATPase
MKKRDKYDDQIEAIRSVSPRERKALIYAEWTLGKDLFAYAGTLDKFTRTEEGLPCGCLTMIRSDEGFVAQTSALTKAIKADTRIPDDPEKITLRHLPVFAEWQRRLDKELGR